MTAESTMEGFRTVARVAVRFRDLDALGHVNNADYFTYLEMARFEYLKRAFGVTKPEEVDIVIARAEMDYASPVFYGEDLLVGVRVSEVRAASFVMEYRLEEAASRRLVGAARTVQVCWDFALKKIKRISEERMELMKRYDGLE